MHPSSVGTQYVKSNRGLSVIEILVTLAVGGILAAVALPAFSALVQNDRDIDELNSLVSSLDYARTEAAKRDVNITVCASTDGSTCNGANWANGWIVVDASRDARPLRAMPALNPAHTLTSSGSTASVTFQSRGLITPTKLTTFTICDARGAADAREIEISSTGRVAASQKPGHSIAGRPLDCPRSS
jgi:type IV fimbrial biogenesis protein FimT